MATSEHLYALKRRNLLLKRLAFFGLNGRKEAVGHRSFKLLINGSRRETRYFVSPDIGAWPTRALILPYFCDFCSTYGPCKLYLEYRG